MNETNQMWLEYPSYNAWSKREQFFEYLFHSYEESGSYLVSEQACALMGEVQVAFCAGAWLSVIVLTVAVIDAQLRETELIEGNTKQILNNLGMHPDFQKLRIRRNALVHLNPENPAITVDQQWANRNELEQEAMKAVKLMFEAFYMNPGI